MRSKRIKYLPGLLLSLFICGSLLPQSASYHVRLIRHPGLMNPVEIEQIIKDDKGFLWLMAASKVQRYDGQSFKSFSFDERCVSIQQDAKGIIWIATRLSIYQFKNEYSGFERIEHLTRERSTYRRLLTGPDNKLYVLHTKGLSRWNETSQQFESAGFPPFTIAGSFEFLKSRGNCLYFRSGKNILTKYNVSTGQADSVTVTSPNYLYFINDDSVWVRQDIGSSALVSFKNKTVQPVRSSQFDKTFNDDIFQVMGCYAQQQPGMYIVFIYGKGYFSFTASSGIFSKIHLFNNGLPLMGQPPVNNFFQEKNGIVWFANEEGLVHYNPYSYGFGLLRGSSAPALQNWNNDVRNFAEDKEGNIWFATGNGFCKWDKKKEKIITWEPKSDAVNYLNYSSVRSIGFTNEKLIVGQSEKGFWLFDPITEKFARPVFENDSIRKKFLDDFNTNLIKLRNGNFLILSRNTWLLDKETLKIRLLKINGVPSSFKTAYEDNKGRIWLAGLEGVYAVDENFNVLYSLKIPEFRFWCNALLQVDDKTLLVAAKYVYEIKPQAGGQLSWRAVLPELKDAHVSHLFKDSLGHIWMNSDRGLHRYIREKKVVESFDPDDNVQQYYVGLSNSFRATDGMVYCGSMNGINYFIPEKIPLQSERLQVYISNITVNKDDSSWLLGHAINNLNFRQNSVVFDFISPYVYSAGKIKYRYRFTGANKNWIETGSNSSVRLTALKPGRYTFQASATINGKDWYETTPFKFIIRPPYSQTWWFRALLAVTAIFLITYYIRRRIHNIKYKAAIKQQMTELEVKALRAQMNPHFIFNAMNSIQQFTLLNDVDNANLYISRFSTLLRKLLHSSQQNFITLEEEIEQLNLYLEIEKLRLGDDFTYQVHANEEIETDAVKVPGMLVQPFVENAIKHGLAMKEGTKKLTVEFMFTKENTLQAVITDNGIGRKKAGELKQQQGKLLPYESKGMSLVEERMALLGKKQAGGGIEIHDLSDANGNACGTRVVLQIPLQ